MSESITRSTTTDALIDELLYGFDIDDDDTREFLSAIIASGQAPQAELEELQQLSLMRGVEEWDMLFGCASALRDGSAGPAQGGDLLPFLEELLGSRVDGFGTGEEPVGRSEGKGRGGASKKRGPRGRVSHFWEEDCGASEVGRMRRRQNGSDFKTQHQRTSQTTPEACGKQLEEPNGVPAEITRVDTQGTSPTYPAAGAEVCASVDEISGDTGLSKMNSGPHQSALPYRPSGSKPGFTRESERAFKATGATRSPFFAPSTPSREQHPKSASATPSTAKKPRPPRGTVSCLPIPPLSASHFGLIQEELADDSFRLLIAVTFLIRTAGKAAIPVFRELMARLPTPAALAAADPAEIIALIRPLGLSAVRCAAIQRYARVWLDTPPTREVRYGVKNYPRPGDGRGVKVGEEFGPEDGDGDGEGGGMVDATVDARERAVGSAWEVGHLTRGPYALDSWRIFCRDVLLGRSTHWTGWRDEPEFQPEWMRVLPRDKELRACLRWLWMREGWKWDPVTGEREPLPRDLEMAVNEGRVGYDDTGNLVILDQETGEDILPSEA